jgi:hypothetical protein
MGVKAAGANVLKSGSLKFLKRCGPVQACNGISLLLIYLFVGLLSYVLKYCFWYNLLRIHTEAEHIVCIVLL